MEKIILDQIMKLSQQMGEMHAELRADINAQGKKLDSLEQKVDAQGQKMDVGFARIEEIIEENAKDTAKIFHDIFRNLGEKERKIINLYK